MVNILDLSAAPEDPMERLLWLSGARKRAVQEIDGEFQRLYFQMRLEGRLDDAEKLNLHSHKRIMAWTRAENESRGRMIRWGDRRS
jgi:hypothetical protein